MRISITSLNLWNTEELDKRKESLIKFIETYNSDIFCFQEIREELIDLFAPYMDGAYHHIEDANEMGWKIESNIYFKKDLFKLISYGKYDLNMPEKDRGLFWVKLEEKSTGKKLLVYTVHFTHQENADELKTGVGYRHNEAKLAARFIVENEAGTPTVITGDFNDPLHPARILIEDANMVDIFRYLHEPQPVTVPNTYLSREDYLVEAIDKILVKNVKPLMAYSPHFHIPCEALSDHFPVTCMIET